MVAPTVTQSKSMLDRMRCTRDVMFAAVSIDHAPAGLPSAGRRQRRAVGEKPIDTTISAALQGIADARLRSAVALQGIAGAR